MKKLIAALVALMLVLSMTVCFAETAEPDLRDLSDVQPSDFTKDDPAKSDDLQLKGTLTQDVVTINGNSYKVVLPSGVTMEFTANGNCIALTQDLIQQSDLFVRLYQNPAEVIDRWINSELHLNIFDTDTKLDLYIHAAPSSLAVIYPDSSRLEEEEANHIIEFMKGQPRYFQGASDVACGWIGKNVWFLGDMRAVDGTVTLVSFVGGQEIYAYARIESEVQYSSLLAHLENLVITAA